MDIATTFKQLCNKLSVPYKEELNWKW